MKIKILTLKFWKRAFGLEGYNSKNPEEENNSKFANQQIFSKTQPKKISEVKSLPLVEEKNEVESTIETKLQTIEKKESDNFAKELSMVTHAKKKDKSLVRSELNLEQNSVFTVSTYRQASREVFIKNSTGDMERKIIIGRTADGKETGILTTYHFKVYLALLDLWEKAGKPTNERIHFTILNILKRLGMTDSGSNYETTKLRLMNLSQIPITFIDSFYISEEESFSSLKPFQVLSYLDIYERRYNTRKGQIVRGYGEFRFHDNILSSLINNYSHPLRLDVITGFKRHRDLAILLYTYLDRQLAFRNKYEISLGRLFEYLDLGQKQIRYPAARKDKIEPILYEICGKELSTGILSHAEIVKTVGGKDYKLVHYPATYWTLL